jgi:hypothetical protein
MNYIFNLNKKKTWNIIRFISILVFFSFNESLFSQGWLYTDSNKIHKENGTVFSGRGANIFDTRSCNAATAFPPNVDEVKRRIDELVDIWGADYMRLTLESYESLQSWQVHGLSVLEDTAYLNDIVEIVEHIGTKDSIYVLVSIWNDPSLDEMGWPTEETIETWRMLVPRLAQYPYVLFGVCNEPQSNSDGALDPDVWEVMNNTVAAIRAAEDTAGSPGQHVITVQGTRDWARYLGYYVDHPIAAGGGTNIAYETHCYDHELAFPERFIGPSEHIPVVIGEFGPATIGGTLYMTLEECQLMMDEAEDLQIPYTAWSFHQRCPPSLLEDLIGSGPGTGMELVTTEWGELVMDQLLAKEAPRIRNFEINPERVINNIANEITISASITDEVGSIASAILDLTEVGGGSEVPMSNSGDNYTASHTITAGFEAGIKKIYLIAVNDREKERTKSIELQVVAPATEDLIIYNDSETLIEATWAYNGTLSEITSGAYEGTNHYQFDYDISGWYAGFGLNLINWEGDGFGYDFTGYDSLVLAGRLTGDGSVSVNLLDADNTTTSDEVTLNGISDSYQEFRIPLSSFRGMPLDDISEITVGLSGVQSGSGIFCIDDIRLTPVIASVGEEKVEKTSGLILRQNYPNPFNTVTTFSFNLPSKSFVTLKIFDLLGRELETVISKELEHGRHTWLWNARKLPSGTYYYRIQAGNFTETKKLEILR